MELSHSQPFRAHGRLDLTTAHNGHITNYHQLRRRYEQHGVRFYTENDSEIVGIYLAARLQQGGTLEDTLVRMVLDLDGSFSRLAATESEFGFLRDSFALKPLDRDHFEMLGQILRCSNRRSAISAVPSNTWDDVFPNQVSWWESCYFN